MRLSKPRKNFRNAGVENSHEKRKSITLPPYVKDVAKVVIWCAFAETNLGEASFKSPVS